MSRMAFAPNPVDGDGVARRLDLSGMKDLLGFCGWGMMSDVFGIIQDCGEGVTEHNAPMRDSPPCRSRAGRAELELGLLDVRPQGRGAVEATSGGYVLLRAARPALGEDQPLAAVAAVEEKIEHAIGAAILPHLGRRVGAAEIGLAVKRRHLVWRKSGKRAQRRRSRSGR